MAQRSSTTAFAKSTRPEISGVVQRETLFSRLDGTPARTVIWISAPPGFGKTTLAASYVEARNYRWAWYQVDPDDDDGETFLHYLAHAMRKLRGDDPGLPVFGPEHRDDIAAFARRFFRALFAGAAGPIALVLDNLHELSTESPLRAILEAGLPQVPRQCCVIVTSRAPPPVALSRLQPGGQMVCVGVNDLKITPAELIEMARLRGKPLAAGALLQLHQRADGWAAALVLMVEHHKLADAGAKFPGEITPEVVFDYLAGEIFERFEASTRRLLLEIACVPRITIDIAQKLSGAETAGRVLFNLAHNDYFVRELVGADGRVFLFHPLLREFLLRRAARDLPAAVSATALHRAASLLLESGQPEDAVGLFVECKDWPEVAAIAVAQADSLLAQGRHATLAAWLEWLPPQELGKDPALLLAHGAALLRVRPRVARRRYEEAFEVAQRAGDVRNSARACRGVIDAMLHEFDDLAELDRWLVAYERCRETAGDVGNPPVEVLVARLWRDPGHPAVTQGWHPRNADGSTRMALARSIAALLNGDFARAAAITDELNTIAGAAGPQLAAAKALRNIVDGDHAAALEAAREGLAISSSEAIHGHDTWLHLLCAAAALGQEDVDIARSELAAVETMVLRRGDRAIVHCLRGWLAHAAGDPGVALREARGATVLAVEAGLPWVEGLSRLGMAQLLAAAGDRNGTEAQVRSVQALAQQLRNPLLQLAILLTQATAAMAFDDEADVVTSLQTGLALARELGVHHVVGLRPVLLGSLCAVALRHGIAIDHTRSVISAANLAPPPAALRLRRWPWAFEVTTLGGFGLQHAGEVVEFSTKGPGRPVELLKVLVSLGGQNVRADQLADALWPHVDADYAHKSFTATLHRLRRIFDEDETLKLRDGRLSLNPSMFWVDTWAMDHLLAELEARLRDGNHGAADRTTNGLVEETLSLYKGPFLPDEAEQPAYIARREQLRARLLRVLVRVARRWEETGHSDAAVDCYLRCIDADELCEAFYRNLMLCYQRHGDLPEALATYERLQAVLAARLRSVPSPETQTIRDGLRA
ncbi:MAG: BTAD domain-containing putative transcriptional regulator [Caldimonas sp.]